MNIESRGTLARIKPRLRSNTRRLVVQGNRLKIYFALCPCPVVAEASQEEPGAAASNSDTTAARLVRRLSSAARADTSTWARASGRLIGTYPLSCKALTLQGPALPPPL